MLYICISTSNTYGESGWVKIKKSIIKIVISKLGLSYCHVHSSYFKSKFKDIVSAISFSGTVAHEFASQSYICQQMHELSQNPIKFLSTNNLISNEIFNCLHWREALTTYTMQLAIQTTGPKFLAKDQLVLFTSPLETYCTCPVHRRRRRCGKIHTRTKEPFIWGRVEERKGSTCSPKFPRNHWKHNYWSALMVCNIIEYRVVFGNSQSACKAHPTHMHKLGGMHYAPRIIDNLPLYHSFVSECLPPSRRSSSSVVQEWIFVRAIQFWISIPVCCCCHQVSSSPSILDHVSWNTYMCR